MASIGLELLEVRRVLASYAPDVTFGFDGYLPTLLPDDTATLYPDVTFLRADRRGLLVARDATVDGKEVLRLERYTLDGQPDAAFTPRNLALPEAHYAYNASTDAQGRILLARYDPQRPRLMVLRYNADGTPDTTFGNDGVARTALVPKVDRSSDYDALGDAHVTVDADGAIYVAGYKNFFDNETEYVSERHYVFKLRPDGQIDRAFGRNGALRFGERDPYDQFFIATTPHSDLIVGQSDFYSNAFTFSRFTSRGRPDTDFGTNGRFTYASDSDELTSYDPDIDAQGRPLLGITESAVDLLRLNTDGVPDPDFGIGGFARGVFRGTEYTSLQAMLVLDDGKLLLQVVPKSYEARRPYLIRLNDDGSHDTDFDDDGVVDLRPIDSGQNNFRVIIAQLADGSFLAANSAPAGQTNGSTLEKVSPVVPFRRGTSGRLYLTGGDGDDRVTVSNAPRGVTRVILNGRRFDVPQAVTGIVADLGGGDNLYDAPLAVPQNVRALDGNDTLTTGDGDDVIRAAAGSDTVRTRGGYDDIRFGGGDKEIDAGPGSGSIAGGGGSRRSAGSAGPYGSVHVVAPSTDDAKQGGWTIDLRGTRVSVTVGGQTADVTVLASEKATVDANGLRKRLTITLRTKRATLLAKRATVRATVIARVASSIVLGPRNDTVTADAGADTIDGGAGDDQLEGGGGGDVLIGGAGNDSLFGNAGNDQIYAGERNRRVAAAVNHLSGGDGEDGYRLESENDVLAGLEVLLDD